MAQKIATIDLDVSAHGNIFLITPLTDVGRDWIHDFIPHAQTFGPAAVVEHRFIGDVVYAAAESGLVIR